jgi:hypothetical protein
MRSGRMKEQMIQGDYSIESIICLEDAYGRVFADVVRCLTNRLPVARLRPDSGESEVP